MVGTISPSMHPILRSLCQKCEKVFMTQEKYLIASCLQLDPYASCLIYAKVTPATNALSDEDIKALTRRTQDDGPEVVEAKADKGFATFFMAYAGVVFVDACLRGLNGVPDIME